MISGAVRMPSRTKLVTEGTQKAVYPSLAPSPSLLPLHPSIPFHRVSLPPRIVPLQRENSHCVRETRNTSLVWPHLSLSLSLFLFLSSILSLSLSLLLCKQRESREWFINGDRGRFAAGREDKRRRHLKIRSASAERNRVVIVWTPLHSCVNPPRNYKIVLLSPLDFPLPPICRERERERERESNGLERVHGFLLNRSYESWIRGRTTLSRNFLYRDRVIFYARKKSGRGKCVCGKRRISRSLPSVYHGNSDDSRNDSRERSKLSFGSRPNPNETRKNPEERC